MDAGAAGTLSLGDPLEALDRARREMYLAESRARLVREIAEMARAEQMAEKSMEEALPDERMLADRYEGDGQFNLSELPQIMLAFEMKFTKPLPVSARGQTAVHRALGFDHRNRVDVAVHPDTPEGIWLRQFLKSNRIPYFAFRSSVPGRSTAAHIHIGPLSGHIAKGG